LAQPLRWRIETCSTHTKMVRG